MQNKTNYYFLLGSPTFLLKDEPLEEILRERVHYYVNSKKYIDFWIIHRPKFLVTATPADLNIKYSQEFSSKDFFSIISTNKNFITWLKLRLNNVCTGNFIAPSEKISSPLEELT